MDNKSCPARGEYAFDTQAGPVFRAAQVSAKKARSLAEGRERPHVIDVLVWPYPEARKRNPELRAYYALNLPQAVARAVEVEIRLREQGLRAALVAVHPADTEETEMFFRALEELEALMPGPLPESFIAGNRGRASTDAEDARAEPSLPKSEMFGKSERSGTFAANNQSEGREGGGREE
jgi:hypothetical protein